MKTSLYIAQAAAIGSLSLLMSCGVADRVDTTQKSSEALVTVRGTNAEQFRAALFTLNNFEVTADGQPLAARVESTKLDLAQGQEQVVGRVDVPAQAQKLQIMLGFDDYGGFEAKSGESGALDARGAAFNFEVPAAAVAGGKATLSFDVGRSLIERMPSERALVPHFVLSY
jgi:hypothetical protein